MMRRDARTVSRGRHELQAGGAVLELQAALAGQAGGVGAGARAAVSGVSRVSREGGTDAAGAGRGDRRPPDPQGPKGTQEQEGGMRRLRVLPFPSRLMPETPGRATTEARYSLTRSSVQTNTKSPGFSTLV